MPTARRVLAEPLEARRLRAATFPQVFGGRGFDDAEKVVQTTDGGLIVTGLFSGTTNFARAGQRARTLSASGDTDIYVASYAADGTLNWAIGLGGDYHSPEMSRYKKRDIQITQTRFSRYVGRIGAQPRLAGEYVNDIAVDDSGNIYLAGAFRDTIKAGRFTLTADQTYTSSYYDALVLKISAAGSVTWARKFGGAFDDDALSIGVDATGRPTIGGYYTRQADFDPSGRTKLLESDGRDNGYVLRLTTDGDLAWVYQFDSDAIGTDERNAVNDLVVTRRGEVYFDGTFAADADFRAENDGGSGDDAYVLKADKKTDAFVAKLDRKGALVWAESTGGKDYDGNSAIALDAAGNVYTAGYFSDEVDVDPRPDVERLLQPTSEDGDNNPQFSDLLISRFTPDGTPVWQSQIGGQYIEVIANLTISPAGGIYTTGSFFNSADFDPGRGTYVLNSVPTNAGSIKDKNTRFGRDDSYDWFVSELSLRGKFVAATHIGGQDDDYAGGLTVLADGDLLAYGRAVSARTDDRDDRQEQALIELLDPELKIL